MATESWKLPASGLITWKAQVPSGKSVSSAETSAPIRSKIWSSRFQQRIVCGVSGWVNHHTGGGGYNQQKYIDWYIWKSICTTRQYTDRPLWVFDGMMTCYLMLMGKMSPITWYSKLAKKTHCNYFITISAALACPSNTGWWMLISLTNADDFTALELGEASS